MMDDDDDTQQYDVVFGQPVVCRWKPMMMMLLPLVCCFVSWKFKQFFPRCCRHCCAALLYLLLLKPVVHRIAASYSDVNYVILFCDDVFYPPCSVVHSHPTMVNKKKHQHTQKKKKMCTSYYPQTRDAPAGYPADAFRAFIKAGFPGTAHRSQKKRVSSQNSFHFFYYVESSPFWLIFSMV
jgi:hypothetical protein